MASRFARVGDGTSVPVPEIVTAGLTLCQNGENPEVVPVEVPLLERIHTIQRRIFAAKYLKDLEPPAGIEPATC